MTNFIRSEGQRSRHEAARKAKDDRRRLAELLARHEVTLENMIGEISAALSGLDEDAYIRGYVRLKLGIDDSKDDG